MDEKEEKEKEEKKNKTEPDEQGAEQGGTDGGAEENTQTEKEAAAEYARKLAELESREMKLLLREKLHDRDMPKELADIISCTDEKDIDKKLDILQKCGVGAKNKEPGTGFVRIGAPKQTQQADPYRKVMGLK